ncbi:VOC family protein [Macrococcus sp. DPC7161]|uniref:VOC family protein n=1 Tax=Macrococcus sp. DPC7161 TaxID=2507060 RepID=UPI00100B9BF4|nr:VOC family protein [Macrococcus sp. DPC7161]RXK19221.1 hypothetical protein ER639_02570 [Macrococcus sp. DPC7161]
MDLLGLHQITAITKDKTACIHFYRDILGMKFLTEIKDEQGIPQIIFGDDIGQSGSIVSFKVYNVPKKTPGTNEIFAYCLRVPTDRSLYEFKLRFDEFSVQYDNVIKINGHHALPFYDHENRLVYLISDENNSGIPLKMPVSDSPIEGIHQILGIGPVLLNIEHTLITGSLLTQVLGLSHIQEYEHASSNEPVIVYSIQNGGNGAEVHVLQQNKQSAKPGSDSIHHITFSILNLAELEKIQKQLSEVQIQHSGIVDRGYARTLHFKDISGIILEFSTIEPGISI